MIFLLLIVVGWHYNTTSLFYHGDFLRDLWMPAFLWIVFGVWLLLFSLPFGFLTGILFDAIIGLPALPEAGREGQPD